jgi:hypothetical protein
MPPSCPPRGHPPCSSPRISLAGGRVSQMELLADPATPAERELTIGAG